LRLRHALPDNAAAMMTAWKGRNHYQRLRFALAGIVHAWRCERSLRLQALALLGVVALLAWLRPPAIWWALIALVCAVVIAAELFNTAIEALADHLHPEEHPSIRTVKDCAAAAVLIAALGALAVALAFALWWWAQR
jgi:undecaprenol kinase